MLIRATIRVHGEVQGVAFRPTIQVIVNKIGIKGTIENRDDGSVLLVCEAQKQDIELLIEKIKNMDAPAHITRIQVEYSEATGEYRTFRVILGDIQEEMFNAITAGAVILQSVSKDVKSINEKTETLIEYARDNSKQNETIMGQNETLIEYARDNSKKTETLIEYARDNSKQNETIMGQNETLIEYARDNSKQNKTMLVP